jgi:hypothetical protein
MNDEKERAANETAQDNRDFDRKDNENISESSHSDKKSLHESPQLPTWGFPPAIRGTIDEVSEVYQCPKDFITVAIVSAVGAAVGTRICSFDGKYTNYANSLWFVIIAPTGSTKTESLRFVMKPLEEINADLHKLYKSRLEAYRKNGGDIIPKVQRVIIKDATAESMFEKLDLSPSLLLYRDEFSAFLLNFNKYCKSGSNVENYLSLFNNNQVTIDRKAGDSLLIPNPALGMIGGIQPEMLQKCFSEFVENNNGFGQRFLFCYPDSKIPTQYSELTIKAPTTNYWNGYLKNLYYGINDGQSNIYGENGIKMTFSKEAMDLYKTYYSDTQQKIIGTPNGYIQGIYKKLQVHVERYALVTAIMDEANSRWNEIRPIHMKFAIESMAVFEKWALAVYDRIRGTKNDEKNAGELIREFDKRFHLKQGKQTALAECFEDLSQSLISLSLSGKR